MSQTGFGVIGTGIVGGTRYPHICHNLMYVAVVAMLPPMIIFLALGRYVMRGLTFGAVKG